MTPRRFCASTSQNWVTDQSSVLRFVKDNWGTGRIGGGSYHALAGCLSNLFDFDNREFGARRLILDPGTGEPSSRTRSGSPSLRWSRLPPIYGRLCDKINYR